MDYTQKDVDKILEASEKATPEPWVALVSGGASGSDWPLGASVIGPSHVARDKSWAYTVDDGILLAGAPILVEEVKRLRAENERLHSDLVFLRREYFGDVIDRTL